MTMERPRGSSNAVRGICAPIALGIFMNAGAAEVDLRTFEVRGVVEKLIPAKAEAVVRHEAIPGYMSAMTMPLRARDGQDLAGLKPGETITFRLNVTDHDGWMDHVKVVAASPLNARPSAALVLPDLDPIQRGQPFPNATLADERGREFDINFYRYNTVAITFIFTRCPYPNFCPRITENFAAVQSALSADAQAPKNWRLLSITIDPDHDTPEVLRAYAVAHKADPTHWRFATGSLRAITTLALRCGLNFWDENGAIQHNLRTIVIDPTGKVRRIFPDNDWTPAELAAELRAAAMAQP
jgi:protein SCO1/2